MQKTVRYYEAKDGGGRQRVCVDGVLAGYFRDDISEARTSIRRWVAYGKAGAFLGRCARRRDAIAAIVATYEEAPDA